MNTRIAQFLCIGALSLLLLVACKKYDDCPTGVAVLEEFVNDGQEVAIYADGKAYTKKRGLCSDPITYFDPNFVAQNYFFDSTGVYIRTEGGALFPSRNRYQDNFEAYASLLDVFAISIQDSGKFWTGFTAQSPDHPEIADYVALRQCILAGTCAFTDNKLELVSDPTNAANHCLKMHAAKPSRKMVTSKMSIESPMPYFVKGMDLWFQADFFLNGSTYPYSLVDFENPYFEQSPGPRIVFDGPALAWENKFGAKDKTSQTVPVTVPTNRWFTLKVHIFFTNTADGLLELWQDGLQVLRANGKTLPTANSIQSSLEVGISATDEENEIFLDNVRLSDVAF